MTDSDDNDAKGEAAQPVSHMNLLSRLEHISANPTVAAVAGAVVGALLAGWLTYFYTRHSSPVPETLGSPSITISSLRYSGPPPDRYEVTGTVRNLAPLQVVWSFNQPVFKSGSSGPIHADPGPCSVSAADNFTCSLGEAVSNTDIAHFNVIVAVVTDGQAADFAAQKAGFEELQDYGSLAALPTVEGSHITDTREILPAG
jgi:hypothetical protein